MISNVNIMQWLGNGAIMSLAPGRLLLGWGKLHKNALPATNNKISFYFPNFFLVDASPWFHYEFVEEIEIKDLLQLILKHKAAFHTCSSAYTWKNEHYPLFCRTFEDLKLKIASKQLHKAVPFIFETSSATMTTSHLINSLCNLLGNMQGHPLYLYGFWDKDEGMLGLTPEILFRYQTKEQLQTMACAGTCGKNADIKEFLLDPKQAQEHQIVVDGISHALNSFGKVNVGEKQLLSLPNINHLVTPITVDLAIFPDFKAIVGALHPTPALGAFPRNPGNQWLKSYEQHIRRRRFGAPAGYINGNGSAACYVAIRNIQWDQKELLIGAGCGIVADSQCDDEWKEINLKLKAIKKSLGLP